MSSHLELTTQNLHSKINFNTFEQRWVLLLRYMDNQGVCLKGLGHEMELKFFDKNE